MNEQLFNDFNKVFNQNKLVMEEYHSLINELILLVNNSISLNLPIPNDMILLVTQISLERMDKNLK